jgi:hypothetical protein
MRRGFLLTLLALGACIATEPRQSFISRDNRAIIAGQFIENSLLCTVRITGGSGKSGTGFPIATQQLEDGSWQTFYITASHVVEGETTLLGEYFTNGKEILNVVTHRTELFVERTNEVLDYALLSGREPNQGYCYKLADRLPDFMEEVYAVGSPMGEPTIITDGHVIRPYDDRTWVVTAPIVFGNSGGPVISKRTGEVVGITIAVAILDPWSGIPVYHLHLMLPSYKVLNDLKN